MNGNVQNPELTARVGKLQEVLTGIGVNVKDIRTVAGGTVTLFKVYLGRGGGRVSRIRNSDAIISRALKCSGVRVVPLEDSVGIEVPNGTREPLSLREVIESACKSPVTSADKALPLFLGIDIARQPFVIDLAEAPHILVAGATKQGKTMCIHDMICSLLLARKDVKFVMADPKMVELPAYDNLPAEHFFKSAGVLHSPSEVACMIDTLNEELDSRYEELGNGGCNRPKVVVIIDEYADYMSDREWPRILKGLLRIAQKGRAIGMHCIISTQRADKKVISGLIKANFPTRIAMRTASVRESTAIIDLPGAESLQGSGDALVAYCEALTRVQCASITKDEIDNLVSDEPK